MPDDKRNITIGGSRLAFDDEPSDPEAMATGGADSLREFFRLASDESPTPLSRAAIGNVNAIGISRLKACVPLFRLLSEVHHQHGIVVLERIGKKIDEKLDKESFAIMDACGISPAEHAWVEPQIRALIAEHLYHLWQIKGLGFMETPLSRYFNAGTPERIAAQVPGFWRDVEPKVAISTSLLNAVSAVEGAYCKADLYHCDRDAVIVWANTLLLDGARHAIDIIEQEHPSNSESGGIILYQSMLKQSGMLLADVWNKAAQSLPALLESMPADKQKLIASNGYPLDELKRSFFARLDVVIDIAVNCMDAVSQKTSFAPSTP